MKIFKFSLQAYINHQINSLSLDEMKSFNALKFVKKINANLKFLLYLCTLIAIIIVLMCT